MEEVKITTNSRLETQKIGLDFAKKFKVGDIVCLYGNLGSGKTTFTQGLAKGLGISKRIISPTFVILRTYNLKSATSELNSADRFCHIDLYRLNAKTDLESAGVLEILSDKSAIIAIEWPEKMENLLPNKRWEIRFNYLEENKREITIRKFK